jgi:hypothetical protein
MIELHKSSYLHVSRGYRLATYVVGKKCNIIQLRKGFNLHGA